MSATLQAQWRHDVAALPGPADVKDAAFAEIIRAHSEPHRRYHGLGHLKALFSLLAQYAPAAAAPLRFAVWWHDVIYEPMTPDNEERSAVMAKERLSAMGVESILIDAVEKLILATKNHWEGPSLGEGDLFLDADIAILGADGAAYDQYARDVRTEYSAVPEALFRGGRAKFLAGAMDRKPMFRTEIFERAFGDTARANMQREHARLSAI
ncbi:MAG: hypothetical protein ABWZ40_02695 [Caulobacterales bacterium]